MNQFVHHCGSMLTGGQSQALCEPLAALKREHGPLREKMDEFAREAAKIGMIQEKTDWSEEIASLKEKVEAFARELDPHSEREEGTLFPLMAKFIGSQTGPIAVMEHEHDLAKQNLKKFGDATQHLAGSMDAAKAKEIAFYALQAHAILTDHFMKEENVLFPMAENMLNAEEKKELELAFGLS